MDSRGIAARIYDLPTAPRRAAIFLLLGLTAGASWWALVAVTPDIPVSIWFAGAAGGVITVLASRGRRLAVAVLVAVSMALVGIGAGRPIDLSVIFGIALGAESWVVARMLTRGRPHALLRNIREMSWLLVSGAVGAGVVFMVAGTGAALFIAGANPALVGAALFTSHLSAVVAIVPIALVPIDIPFRRPRWELVLEVVALVVLTTAVFGPAAPLALTFLLVTVLMWAAFQFPPLNVAVQTIGLATAATVATSAGLGPFAVLIHDDLPGSILALQLFILTHAVVGLFVSVQTAEWRSTAEELAARERDALSIATELADLNQKKDDFISAVSHELRTPVTIILGFSEQLIDSPTAHESAQAGPIIYRNARRLADVIEDVLELSRLSTTQGSNRPSAEVDVTQLLRDCVDDTVGLVALGRDVRIDMQVPDERVVVVSVAQDLVRVFTNLLANALKFSPRGGTVTVKLSEHERSITVSFADEGPGIPLAEQEAVWERFYRVQSPQHRDVPGTGLGLPIARSLVENRIGGSITLTSDGEHGTVMAVTIPRTSVAVAPGDHETTV